eukprot:jgi/Chlat1/8745/Chrsp9S09300
MDLLASELVGEVLSRLGGRELARCACVCRAWRQAALRERLKQRQSVYNVRTPMHGTRLLLRHAHR